MKPATLADLKRLPIGTRLYLTRTIFGPVDPPRLRILAKVRRKELGFTGDGVPDGQMSWLPLPSAELFRPTERGFQILRYITEARLLREVIAEYVWPEA